MSDYLHADELAELTGYKASQKKAMTDWLKKYRWAFVIDRDQFPRVLREYRNRKMGLVNDEAKAKLDHAPNLDAFKNSSASVGKNRHRATV